MTDRAKKLEEVKNLILSALTPHANGLELKALDREFRDMVGTNIRYHQFGYNTLLSFLRDMPDVVEVFEAIDSDELWVTSVGDRKSKHISEFVQRQKKTKPSKSKTPEEIQKQVNERKESLRLHGKTRVVNVKIQERIEDILIKSPKVLTPEQLAAEYQTRHQQPLLFEAKHFGFSTVEEMLRSMTAVVSVVNLGPNTLVKLKNGQKKREAFRLSQSSNSSIQNLSEGKRSVSLAEEPPSSVFKAFKSKLVALMKEHPEGLLMSDLPEKFSAKYGYTFDVKDHGFSNLKAFCFNNVDIFRLGKRSESNEIELFPYDSQPEFEINITDICTSSLIKANGKPDLGQLVPDKVINNIKATFHSARYPIPLMNFSRSYRNTNHCILQTTKYCFRSVEELLRSLSIVEFMVKEGVTFVKLAGSDDKSRASGSSFDDIPELVLPPEYRNVGSRIPICPGEVFSPDAFNIQILGPEHTGKLDEVMRSMSSFYGPCDSRTLDKLYALTPSLAVVGRLVAAPFMNLWHRAQIIAHASLTTVRVLFLDYGTIQESSLNELRILDRRFADLPRQAIPCKCAGIKPMGTGTYNSDAIDVFYKLLTSTDGENVFAINRGFCQGPTRALEVDLYIQDPSKVTSDKEEGIHINFELVEQGLAALVGLRTGKEKDIKTNLVVTPPEVVAMDKGRIPAFLSSALDFSFPPSRQVANVQPLQVKAAQTSETFDLRRPFAASSNTEAKRLIKANEGNSFIQNTSLLKGEVSLSVIVVDGTAYLTSAEISGLIPKFKKKDILMSMIELKKLSFESVSINRESSQWLYEQALCEGVTGFKNKDGSLTNSVTLFHFKDLSQILSIFLGSSSPDLVVAVERLSKDFV